jgi:hypothetical protein
MASRISQDIVEAVGVNEDANARAAQDIVEVFGVGAQPASVTYERVEIVGTGLQPPYIAQQYIEIFAPNAVPVTQLYLNAVATIRQEVSTPVLFQLTLEGPNVKAIVTIDDAGTPNPTFAVRLYRGPTAEGPWTQVMTRSCSDVSAQTNLYDVNTVFGLQTFYAASAIDAAGNEGALCVAKSIAPHIVS